MMNGTNSFQLLSTTQIAFKLLQSMLQTVLEKQNEGLTPTAKKLSVALANKLLYQASESYHVDEQVNIF